MSSICKRNGDAGTTLVNFKGMGRMLYLLKTEGVVYIRKYLSLS